MTAGADFVPRVSLVSTTVAPGITPPVESFTVPDTVPVVICASAGDGKQDERGNQSGADKDRPS